MPDANNYLAVADQTASWYEAIILTEFLIAGD